MEVDKDTLFVTVGGIGSILGLIFRISITRPADGVPVTATDWSNYTEASIYSRYYHNTVGTGTYIGKAGGFLFLVNNADDTQVLIYDGTTQATTSGIPYPAWNKYCSSYGATGKLRIKVNGGTVAASASYGGSFGQGAIIGFYSASPGRVTMNLQSFVTFNRQVSDTDMGSLTT